MSNLTGIYKAEVVSTADPQYRGRLLLRVPQILGNSLSAWAEPSLAEPTVPSTGDTVYVLFAGGDVARPVYLARATASGAIDGPVSHLSLDDNIDLEQWQMANGQITARMHPLGRIQLGASSDPTELWARPSKSDGTPGGTAAVKGSFLAGGASTVPIVARGWTNATGDLTQWQDSTGTRLASVDSKGHLKSPNLTGAWQAFTLKTSGDYASEGITLGNAVQNCAWRILGDSTAVFRIRIDLGTTSAITGLLSLGPLPFMAEADQVVSAACLDTSASDRISSTAALGAGGRTISRIYTHLFSAGVSTSVPFTWDATDRIYITGTVEVRDFGGFGRDPL